MKVTSEQAFNLREKGLTFSQIAEKLSLSNKGIAYRLVLKYKTDPTYTEKVGNKTRYSKRQWGASTKQKFTDKWERVLYHMLPKYIAKNVRFSSYSIEYEELYDRVLDYAYTTNFDSTRTFWGAIKIMVRYPHHRYKKSFNTEVNYGKKM